ncbi:M48 family metallopeptidase [Candidatus Latescibacterota bacterium]
MNENIPIARIIRSRRRTIALVVTPDATLIVRAPLRTPVFRLEQLIVEKRDWIRRKLNEVRRKPPLMPREYVEGEEFWYLGKKYHLRVAGNVAPQVTSEGDLRLPEKSRALVRETVLQWYRDQAARVVGERCMRWIGIAGCEPLRIRITSARKRWGSCSTKGAVNFSSRLVMAPPAIIDYIIVHELVHLDQPDHSHLFWAKVERILPDYRSREQWLRKHERYLMLP